MNIKSKSAIGLISLPLVGMALFVATFYTGSKAAAASMEELRSSIKVGMSRTEVQALIQDYDGVADDGVTKRHADKAIVQVSKVSRNFTSPVLGSWFCFLELQMREDTVESVSNISCVD